MFIAIEGFPGSGKSTLMAKMAIEDRKAGKPYCCNKPMQGAHHTPTFADILQWCAHHRNGTVYVEEAGVYMRGRTKEVPVEILDLGAQARHLGLDFVLNYQHRLQIDPDILRLCQVVYKSQKLFAGIPAGGFQSGGYLLNPIFRFIAYEPGESEPKWGHTHVLDWVIWRGHYAEMFRQGHLVGKSQHTDRELKSASYQLLEQAKQTEGQHINLR